VAIGTPFYPRTRDLCVSHEWRLWSGYFAASSYNEFVQPEYAAIRHGAALIDISPLYKYHVAGRDASVLLDRVVTHDVAAMKLRQAIYTPWCDGDGRVRQEGTLFRLDADVYQLNAAEPALGWLDANAAGLKVEIVDRSTALAALALQGPASRAVLAAVASPASAVAGLRFFRLVETEIAGCPVWASRTGYTGDLGYEIWLRSEHALRIWDALIEAGRDLHLTPCGLLAMDIARVEAGFVLINVDYPSAETALLHEDTVTPFEIGLGWAVKAAKGPFIGRAALLRGEGTMRRRLVGLEIGWEPLEEVYLEAGLMPDLPQRAVRDPVPVYAPGGGPQIGRATTRVWSTLLKKYIALATLDAAAAELGEEVAIEVTVHWERKRVRARVVEPRFYRPSRLRE
jgi:aminomethyltransferase